MAHRVAQHGDAKGGGRGDGRAEPRSAPIERGGKRVKEGEWGRRAAAVRRVQVARPADRGERIDGLGKECVQAFQRSAERAAFG